MDYEDERNTLRTQVNFTTELIKYYPLYDFKNFMPNLFTNDYHYPTFYLKEGHGEELNIKYYLYKPGIVHWEEVKTIKTNVFCNSETELDVSNERALLLNEVIEKVFFMCNENIKRVLRIMEI